MAKTTIDELMSIGIDIGKGTFHIVAVRSRRPLGNAQAD